MSLTEIVTESGISKSTVYRLLHTLHERHYVEKDSNSCYRIGIKLIETASNHINRLELQTESKPVLATLREGLNLAAHLGILDGMNVVYVEKLDEILFHFKFEQFTPNTITSAAELKQYLKKVRKQGYAMDDQEYMTGHRCIGAPVFDYRGDVIASISASGPITQLTDEKVDYVIKEVKRAAAEISLRMGYSV